MREWRRTHPLTPAQRFKDICRSYAGVYLKRGKIVRQGCVVCGDKTEMHHADYDRPLEVIWLCRPHHLALHRVTHPPKYAIQIGRAIEKGGGAEKEDAA